MKKFIALVMATAMLFSMPVMAHDSFDTTSIVDQQSEQSTEENLDYSINGLPAAYVYDMAQAEGKTIGEYLNNTVAKVPGLPDVLPVGQGGHVIINGAPSNQVFAVGKPNAAVVNAAKAQAALLGGKIVNVVNISSAIKNFQTARVNFYIRGIKAGQNILVYYLKDGQWMALNVAEIRLDHVVVDMTGLGALLIVEAQ